LAKVGMTGFPVGTVTFLFTDVEGSTELLRRLRDEYGSVLGLHRELVRAAVERHRGVEVDTQGDAFFFAFQRASDGVRAAIEAQQALTAEEWPDGVNVRVRMGLHTGEASMEDGRYHGLSVHRAARIAGVAHGGQVLISGSTRALLADEEELGQVGFRDVGLLTLKDFDQPIRVYRLTAPGLVEVQRRPRARAKNRRWLVAAALVIVAIAAAAGVLAASLGGGHSAVAVPDNSVAVVEPSTGKVVDSVPVGQAPTSITLDRSAAWVANGGSGTVTRIDIRTRATSTIGGFQSTPYQLAAGAAQVWVTESTAGLASISTSTQTASAPVPLLAPSGVAYSVQGIASGFGSLWVGGGLPTALVLLRVDPATQRIVAKTRVGPLSRHAIALGEGGVWVSELLANTVSEFDPTNLRLTRRIAIGGPTAIALGGGSLWVCGAADNAVWRLRATDGYSARTMIAVGGDPVAIAYGEGFVWAALADGRLVRIDPATDAVRRTKVASTLNGVAVGSGSVWADAGPVSFL
jgi:class 3 adenylate cyclase/streptogramin lyase